MTTAELMTASEIHELSRQLRGISAIDETVEGLGNILAGDVRMDCPEQLGVAVRSVLGKNFMPHFNDERLGMVVLTGVINGLLYERRLTAEKASGRALVPQSPCVEQQLDAIWEALA